MGLGLYLYRINTVLQNSDVSTGVQLKCEKNILLLPEGVFIIKLAEMIYYFVL